MIFERQRRYHGTIDDRGRDLDGNDLCRDLLTMQNRLMNLPEVFVRQLLSKEAESVSDYALRTAVRNSVQLGIQAQAGTLLQLTQVFNNFQVGHCIIDSIQYSFVETANHYRAKSYVRGTLQDRICLSCRDRLIFPSPDCGIAGMLLSGNGSTQFNPSFNEVEDSSPNENHGSFFGDVTTRPQGTGANGWKCASFGIDGRLDPTSRSLIDGSEFKFHHCKFCQDQGRPSGCHVGVAALRSL